MSTKEKNLSVVQKTDHVAKVDNYPQVWLGHFLHFNPRPFGCIVPNDCHIVTVGNLEGQDVLHAF